MRCWGANAAGQIGQGLGALPAYLVPATVPVTGVVQLAAGSAHACAVTDRGELWCWGSSTLGQIGDGGATGAGVHRDSPTRVAALTDVRQVACGWEHTCAVLGDGSAACWGSNSSGQLGLGTIDTSPHPTPGTVLW